MLKAVLRPPATGIAQGSAQERPLPARGHELAPSEPEVRLWRFDAGRELADVA